LDRYLDEQNASDTYLHVFSYDKPRVMSMVMGRSCPYQCKFCFHPSGNTYRTRSLDNFFTELDEVMERYAPRQLFILDELFSVDLKRVYDFCERIKPYKIKWIIQMRVDIITPELLSALHDAGCVSISYGLESFSSKVLKNMRKNITPEQIEKALKLTYEASIDIQGNFIFGDELEDNSTIYETMRFWFAHPEYMINISMIQTYPGSGYYKD